MPIEKIKQLIRFFKRIYKLYSNTLSLYWSCNKKAAILNIAAFLLALLTHALATFGKRQALY
jgi:hypothetical protein